MSDSLTVAEIKNMSLDELVLNKDKLPDVVDISELTSDNFEDFKFWLDYIDCKEDDNPVKSVNFNFGDSTRYFLSAYGGMPALIAAHEGLHAFGGLVSGATIEKIGVNSTGFYVTMSGDNVARFVSSIAPNAVLPIFGFYYIKKGIDENDTAYLGIGASATLLNFGSIFLDYGDFANLTGSGIIGRLSALGIGLATYGIAYVISSFAYKRSKRFKNK